MDLRKLDSDFMQLDDRDLTLLELLQGDCRTSNAELAEKAGLSTSSCWRRIRALEDNGLIRRYGAQLALEKLGLGFHAIVHVQLTRHDPEKLKDFIRVIGERREVLECYATTGQADYHLRVLVEDISSYNSFLEEVLFRIEAVAGAQTNVILNEVKRADLVALR